nr:type IV pilin-like G/H family protein [Synechococcus sp. BDU 130192]
MQNLALKFALRRKKKVNSEKGFLILDILLSIVILGILVAQGWRSYLKEVNRAKELEALLILRALNQSQSIHYLEYSQFSDVYLPGIIQESSNYRFAVQASQGPLAQAIAIPKAPLLKGYISVICLDGQILWVKTFQGPPNQLPVIDSVSCENASQAGAVKPTLDDLVESIEAADEPKPSEDFKVEIICESGNKGNQKKPGTPPGLVGKEVPGLANKTPPGWEIAPGINKVIVSEGCNAQLS